MSRPNCIITGASGGIENVLALHMADRGYDLILHSRTIASLKPLLKIIDTGQFDINVIESLSLHSPECFFTYDCDRITNKGMYHMCW